MTNTIKQLTGRSEEEGFTLIELMVVVLIIGILMAIAIPTFLGAKNSAQGRAAQSDIRNAITAEQTIYSNGQAYVDASTPTSKATLTSAESAFTWGEYGTTNTLLTGNNVYALVGSTNGILEVVAVGADKNCYYAVDDAGAVSYSQAAGTSVAGPPAGYTCGNPTSWYGSFTDAAASKNALATAPTLPA